MAIEYQRLYCEYCRHYAKPGKEEPCKSCFTDETQKLPKWESAEEYMKNLEAEVTRLQQAMGLLSTLNIIGDVTIIPENPEGMIRVLFDRVNLLQQKNAQLRKTVEAISNICDQKPPYYAYGDSEAGCCMANMIDEIQEIASNSNPSEVK